MRVRFDLLPINGDRRWEPRVGAPEPVPLELASFSDFVASRHGYLPLERDVATTAEERHDFTAENSPLRALARGATLSQELKLHYEVRPDPRSTHFMGRVELRVDRWIVTFAVVRPTLEYLFAATYLFRLPPDVPAPGTCNCFHVRCMPMPSGSVAKVIQDLALSDTSALTHNRVSPNRPRLGNMSPLLTRSRQSTTERTAALEIDHRTGISGCTVDHSKLERSDACERQEAVALAAHAVPRSGAGRRPSVPERRVRSAYEELLPRCAALMDELKQHPWPPFQRASTALPLFQRFLPEVPSGSLGRIVDDVLKRERRPSARSLGMLVLQVLTQQSPVTVRSAIRKK